MAAVLAQQHGRFLAFLTPRVGRRAIAEDILQAAYASILNDVDVEGLSVEESARRAHISASNASVRLHRARKALAARLAQVCGVCATHRCVDCDCRPESRAKS